MSVCEECLFDKLWTDETTTCPKECEGCQIIDGEPSKFKPKPKTNAESITATDDELTTTLHAVSMGYKPWCDYHCENEGDDGCDNCIKEWLQQPAEGDCP